MYLVKKNESILDEIQGMENTDVWTTEKGSPASVARPRWPWSGDLGPLWLIWYNLISAWINHYIHYKVWDEMTYPFVNFNDEAVEILEWISNFIPYFTGHVITYPCCDLGSPRLECQSKTVRTWNRWHNHGSLWILIIMTSQLHVIHWPRGDVAIISKVRFSNSYNNSRCEIVLRWLSQTLAN